MSDMNEDFDLGEAEVAPIPKKATKKKPELDPEHDRANWPVIRIENEEGKPNYEYLAAHGTLKDGRPFDHELQVQRGVDVAVPPSIVRMLRLAISTHMKQVRNPVTGLNDRVFSDRSSIPWQLIKGGKYIK